MNAMQFCLMRLGPTHLMLLWSRFSPFYRTWTQHLLMLLSPLHHLRTLPGDFPARHRNTEQATPSNSRILLIILLPSSAAEGGRDRERFWKSHLSGDSSCREPPSLRGTPKRDPPSLQQSPAATIGPQSMSATHTWMLSVLFCPDRAQSTPLGHYSPTQH
ncbi:unnamed protein product [Merluccius merluccius]